MSDKDEALLKHLNIVNNRLIINLSSLLNSGQRQSEFAIEIANAGTINEQEQLEEHRQRLLFTTEKLKQERTTLRRAKNVILSKLDPELAKNDINASIKSLSWQIKIIQQQLTMQIATIQTHIDSINLEEPDDHVGNAQERLCELEMKKEKYKNKIETLELEKHHLRVQLESLPSDVSQASISSPSP